MPLKKRNFPPIRSFKFSPFSNSLINFSERKRNCHFEKPISNGFEDLTAGDKQFYGDDMESRTYA